MHRLHAGNKVVQNNPMVEEAVSAGDWYRRAIVLAVNDFCNKVRATPFNIRREGTPFNIDTATMLIKIMHIKMLIKKMHKGLPWPGS